MNQLTAYWATLSRRDQTALLICAVAVAIALVWLLAISPSQKAVRGQAATTQAAADSLTRVRQMAEELNQYRTSGSTSGASSAPLSELIDRSLRSRAIAMSSFQPVKEGEVRVRLDDTSYQSFIAWLVDMETTEGLTTKELSITPTSASGRVSVAIRLAR